MRKTMQNETAFSIELLETFEKKRSKTRFTQAQTQSRAVENDDGLKIPDFREKLLAEK